MRYKIGVTVKRFTETSQNFTYLKVDGTQRDNS